MDEYDDLRIILLSGMVAVALYKRCKCMNNIPTGRYRHYKGKEYEVLGMATHSETMEALVVYRALYGEYGLWVRPEDMFAGMVEVEGQMIKRFAYIG